MPELPEVETVVRDLRPLLVGRSIRSVRRSRKKLRRPWLPRWKLRVTGQRVEEVRRRGKWILIDLAGPAILRVHLGMTGQLTVAASTVSRPDHLHLTFALDNGAELRYRDPRRFGAVEWFADRDRVEALMNDALGPEPFGIDRDYFRAVVRASRRNLKAILLDQTVIAGVGNIYADESLFRARLHPCRKGRTLSPAECDRLGSAIETVLMRAIEFRGSTIRDYVGGSGLRGGFQDEFAVYGRTGELCPVCSGAVERLRLAGRSSHFCPTCQQASSRVERRSHIGTGVKQSRQPER
jgi:formamidopyrimidine-DNA glycosylase